MSAGRGLVAGAVAVALLAGCTKPETGSAESDVSVESAESRAPAEAYESTPAGEEATASPAPEPSPAAPDTTEAAPGGLQDLFDGVSAEQIATAVDAMGGPDCAPGSILLDYEAGLLTAEEYTAHSYYALQPFLPPPAGRAEVARDLPERYRLCDGGTSFQMLGLAAGIFLDDIDPVFRDELWVDLTGMSYEEASEPMTDEEIEAALRHYVPVDPEGR